MSTAEYVTDVPYPRSFVHQSSPTTLRLVAALGGVAGPPDDDFAYCDLGSGTGDTLATLAAATPSGHFVGVDFHAEQIESARRLASRAGLRNARFVEADFASLLEQDLPAFDFIVAHGIWTWVSPTKRRAILDFVRAKLKPGGLFYVSYNALPGWAALEPLRRLMLEHTRDLPGGTLERARAGYGFLRRVAEGDAGYFTGHPTARSMLALMEKAKLPYVAHEYFHAHWEPMYFADVARSLARSGLSYVGQVPLHLNVHELAMPPKLKELAGTLGDRVDFETLKDFAWNEPFRADVYRAGGISRSDDTRRAFFAGTSFGAIVPAKQVKREVKLPIYTLDFSAPIYQGILAEITVRPASAAALQKLPALADLEIGRLADALQNLTFGGQVMPVGTSSLSPSSLAPLAPRAAGATRLLSEFNRFELEAGLAAERSVVLAAPCAGIGISLTVLEAACLYLWTCVAVDERKAWIRPFVRRVTLSPFTGPGGRVVSDNEERVRLLGRELERFSSEWAAPLAMLGIVGDDGP